MNTTILVVLLSFILLIHFLIFLLIWNYQRKNLAEKPSIKKPEPSKPKRSILLRPAGGDNESLLITKFKHRTPKSCDFCGRPVVFMVVYDFGEEFGAEIFSCESCLDCAKASATEPINLMIERLENEEEIKRALREAKEMEEAGEFD